LALNSSNNRSKICQVIPGMCFKFLSIDIFRHLSDSLSAISKLKLVELNDFDKFLTLLLGLGFDFDSLHNSFAVFSIILVHLEVWKD
jgi:hypothetical protein